METTFNRPTGTTANPDWFNANCAADIVPVLTANPEEADRFVRLAGMFKLTQGGPGVAGTRLQDRWLPWQRDTIHAMYQVRETFIVCGKGSGKSTLIASAALGYVMKASLDGDLTRSLVAVLAPTIPAARIVFDHIQLAVLSDEELRPQFKSNVQSRSLTHEPTGIVIQVLSVDMKSAVGRRPSFLIIDELHEIAHINDSMAVLDQLRKGGANWGAKFKMVTISTLPPGKSVGEFDRLYRYAKAVRDGNIADPEFLPILYTFPILERPDISPLDPTQFWRGMPSLTTKTQIGTMDSIEVEKELQRAKDGDDPEAFALVMSQRLGVMRELQMETAESILQAKWATCEKLSGGIELPTTIAVGIDAGGIDDPMALAAVFRIGGSQSRELGIMVEQHLVATGYQRATPNLKAVYDKAIKNGTLFLHATTDALEKAVIDKCLGIYRPNGGTTLFGGDEHGRAGFKVRFEGEGGLPFKSVPQNYLLGAALRALEGHLDEGTVQHNHCPLVSDNVENLKVEEQPNGNLSLRKKGATGSGQGQMKVDGIIAVINAMSLLESDGQHVDTSFWIG